MATVLIDIQVFYMGIFTSIRTHQHVQVTSYLQRVGINTNIYPICIVRSQFTNCYKMNTNGMIKWKRAGQRAREICQLIDSSVNCSLLPSRSIFARILQSAWLVCHTRVQQLWCSTLWPVHAEQCAVKQERPHIVRQGETIRELSNQPEIEFPVRPITTSRPTLWWNFKFVVSPWF